MLRFRTLLFLSFIAVSAMAQNTPPPPTPPPPIHYVDRFLDSAQTLDFTTNTFRSRAIKVAPERDLIIFIAGGRHLAAYRLSTFHQRLAEPLATGPRGERLARFDFLYTAMESVQIDSTERIRDFDWDDRRYTYMTNAIEGIDIIDQNFALVRRIPRPNGFSPSDIVSFRAGAGYYILVSSQGGTTSRLYDVTNPSNPIFVATRTNFTAPAKAANGDIAFENFTPFGVNVFTPEALVANGTPKAILPGIYPSITTDGIRFFAVNNGPVVTVTIFSPSGSTYTAGGPIPVPGLWEGLDIQYGNAILTVTGTSANGRRSVVYRADGATLTPINETYFTSAVASIEELQPLSLQGYTLLLLAGYGIGDVFSIGPAPAIGLDVPTASEWGLIAMTVLLAAIALRAMRS